MGSVDRLLSIEAKRTILKHYSAALIAIVVFFVVALLSVDAVTYVLGRPSRGVGYGIGVYYLTITLAVVGSITLMSARWFGLKLSLAIGTVASLACVVILFPQPSLTVRLLLGLWISGVLTVLALLLQKFSDPG